MMRHSFFNQFLFLLPFIVSLLAVSADTEISILYTNNTNGALENCLCPGKAYGSLEKRVHYVREWLKDNPNSLLLDAGDFLSPTRNALKDSIAFRIYEMMAYDAIGLGDQEFFKGAQFISDLMESSSLPFISTNLEKPDLADLKREIVVERGGVRFGILSVIDSGVFLFYPKRVKDEVAVNDFSSTLQSQIDQLKEKSDVVILLSHNGIDADRQIAQSYTGIDVIVGSHTQTVKEEPEVVGKTIIVQGGKDGYYVGHLTLQIDNDKNIVSHEGELIPMDISLTNEPTVVGMIIDYNRIGRERAGSRVERIVPVPAEYLSTSSEACESCHSSEYDNWKVSRHAVSLKTLISEHKEKSPECLACHTTGFGRDDGYLNYNITSGLKNVNCTECHYTPAGHLAEPAAFVTERIEEANCLRCHDEDNSPSFAFTSFMEKSRHSLPKPVNEKVRETEKTEEMSSVEREMVIISKALIIITHTVRKGDTLWSLSERYLGKGGRWSELYESNREMISDPDQLMVGVELRISKH